MMISMMQGIVAINPPLANTISLRQNPDIRVFYGGGSPTTVQSRYNRIINRLVYLKGDPLTCADIAEMCDISVTTAQKNMAIIEKDGFCLSRKVRRIVNMNSTPCLEFFIRP